MTYVKINEETSRKFTAQVTHKEQYEDIIKEAKQQCMVRDNQQKIFKYYR